ncbi:MAG: asparagine synthetase B [Rhodothalassiaceae bacterium]|nr:MAG: asparagine synthetase B [Rhodothalassiaceae bacterium]
MCGIAGELDFSGKDVDPSAVLRMGEVLRPRGPDGWGLLARDGIALGHRRLKVIDLSERAAQPMLDPELGLGIVFNGCIYNYRELRRELEEAGCRFFSEGDTEVLIKAYHAWGPQFVTRLNGMFAFCLFDVRDRSVLLGRDRLGIKPLYLVREPGRLRFASSLPALLAAGGVDTRLDPVALHHYLSFHSVVPPPRTILAGVRKLPPATLLAIDAEGREQETRYWSPSFGPRPDERGLGLHDWNERVLAGLKTAVRRRLVADVPVGVLLSGGLDSSLIVALLADAGQTGLATFSIGFEAVGNERGDEFMYSDLVARRFGTAHTQIRIDTARLLPALEDCVGAMPEPMTSHDAVGFYLLSKEVSRHVKVVQSGQGADEIFGGYHWYPPLLDVGDGDEAVEAYHRVFADRDHDEMARVLEPEWLDGDHSRRFIAAHFARPGADRAIDKALRIDTEIMLVDDPVKRVDSMTMAWGLEARVPFLDHELVELAARIPAELKVAGGGKHVLKEAARSVLPAEVIDRPKGYFPVPALKYIDGPYLELVREILTSRPARARGLFRPDYVDMLLAEPDRHLTPLRGSKLWQLALLEFWLQKRGIAP